jgi:hypothetical protein
MDYNKRSFDPSLLVGLISIRLSPTVRFTQVGLGQRESFRPLESQFTSKKKRGLKRRNGGKDGNNNG